MNIQQQMGYHARKYRELKALLVSDAVNLPHWEKMARVAEGRANQANEALKKAKGFSNKTYAYLQQMLTSLNGVLKQEADPATRKQLESIWHRIADAAESLYMH